MPAIDGWLEGFLQGPTTLWVVLVVSLLVGLRHASDPDHLADVTTLIASQERERIRKATSLGLLWASGTAPPSFSSGCRSCCLASTCPRG